jgi:antirestriction protein ArdC
MDESDFAKRLADKLVEQLKAGTAPRQQPWEAGQKLGLREGSCDKHS